MTICQNDLDSFQVHLLPTECLGNGTWHLYTVPMLQNCLLIASDPYVRIDLTKANRLVCKHSIKKMKQVDWHCMVHNFKSDDLADFPNPLNTLPFKGG